MKYIYQNATGTTEIEVDEEYYDLLIAMDREEYNSDRKHSRRYPVSLEDCEYEGEWFADGTDILGDLIEKESYSRLRGALEQLTPEQQSLIERVYFRNETNVKIAAEQGVSEAAIRERLRWIYKKLKNILL
jgi:RNA polymerase sigma factor (sigma-70 family)